MGLIKDDGTSEGCLANSPSGLGFRIGLLIKGAGPVIMPSRGYLISRSLAARYGLRRAPRLVGMMLTLGENDKKTSAYFIFTYVSHSLLWSQCRAGHGALMSGES